MNLGSNLIGFKHHSKRVMLRTVVHYIMTMKTCHISEVAKEKMTDRQLGDLGKIDCGQPLKIPGGKNMACRQL